MSTEILRVVCGWCTRVLCEGTPGAETSHGMCQACVERMDEDLKKREAA